MSDPDLENLGKFYRKAIKHDHSELFSMRKYYEDELAQAQAIELRVRPYLQDNAIYFEYPAEPTPKGQPIPPDLTGDTWPDDFDTEWLADD